MSETDIQKAIIEWLRVQGFYCQRINSGKMLANYKGKIRMIHLADLGTPDIFACINGEFVGIEVKANEKEKMNWIKQVEKFEQTSYCPPSYQKCVNQRKEHLKIIRAGGHSLVVCSINELERDLKKLNLIIK